MFYRREKILKIHVFCFLTLYLSRECSKYKQNIYKCYMYIKGNNDTYIHKQIRREDHNSVHNNNLLTIMMILVVGVIMTIVTRCSLSNAPIFMVHALHTMDICTTLWKSSFAIWNRRHNAQSLVIYIVWYIHIYSVRITNLFSRV